MPPRAPEPSASSLPSATSASSGSEHSPTRAERLDARYGRRRDPRRGRLVAIIAGTLLVAATVFVGLRFADQPVRADTISYEHADAGAITLTFQVTARPGTAVTCGVQALNATRGQVGFTEIDIPAQGAAQSLHTVEIATQGEAVSAEVVDCERA